MGATVRAIFFTVAVICAAVATFGPARLDPVRLRLIGAALGLFVFVSAWDAWALS